MFEYDALNRLTKVTDPNQLDTNYIYNGFGEQTRLESPDTGFTHYRYDAAGNRTQQTDANSRITDYVYDGLNRITAIDYIDLAGEAGNDATYAYDIAQSVCPAGETFLVGRLSRMTDGSGETAYCYNRFGDLTRKVQITQDKTFVLQWEYAANGRLQKLIYPDGLAVEYLYDTQGRPTEINVATSIHRRQLLRSATYHPFGPVQQWTYGNGRLMQRTLNKNYQPGIVEDAAAGGISEGYKFDAIGDLESLQYSSQDAPSRRVYDHDALSRLTLANDAAGVVQQSYAYDKTGNRMQANVRETVVIGDGGGGGPGGPGGGGTTTRLTTSTYAYVPGKHRLWTTGTIERRYDLAGNLIWIGPKSVDEAPDQPPGDPLESAAYSGTEQPTSGIGMEDGGEAPPGLVEREFTYSGMNRMRSVTYGGNLLMSYRYNGRGERVYRTGSNEAVHTVFDESGHWLGDYDANGAVIQQAIWFNDLPVGLAASINGSVRLHYVQPDALGTPRVVIDPQRDVAVWRWDLAGEAFGDGAPDEDPDGDSHRFVLDMRFPGQQYDSATGFNYNYFRDYDPSTGRYVQSDPIGLSGGISTYGYVSGNPMTRVDPLGLVDVRLERDAQLYAAGVIKELPKRQLPSKCELEARSDWAINMTEVGAIAGFALDVAGIEINIFDDPGVSAGDYDEAETPAAAMGHVADSYARRYERHSRNVGARAAESGIHYSVRNGRVNRSLASRLRAVAYRRGASVLGPIGATAQLAIDTKKCGCPE